MVVTADQVRIAAIHAGIKRIDHHACAVCNYMTAYIIRDGELFFDPGCYCSWYGKAPLEPNTWQSAADWINKQSPGLQRKVVAELFGLRLTYD